MNLNQYLTDSQIQFMTAICFHITVALTLGLLFVSVNIAFSTQWSAEIKRRTANIRLTHITMLTIFIIFNVMLLKLGYQHLTKVSHANYAALSVQYDFNYETRLHGLLETEKLKLTEYQRTKYSLTTETEYNALVWYIHNTFQVKNKSTSFTWGEILDFSKQILSRNHTIGPRELP